MIDLIKSQRLSIKEDQLLEPYFDIIKERKAAALQTKKRLCKDGSLIEFAAGHEYFGLHKEHDSWVMREWAPNATRIYIIGEFSNWEEYDQFEMSKGKNGVWTLAIPLEILRHEMLYRLSVYWEDGHGQRLPAWCRREIQDPHTHLFNAQVWDPSDPYTWKNPTTAHQKKPIIYEAHVGMSSEDEKVASWDEFRIHRLPYLQKSGYNTIQLMAVMEHPYYGSFGYHVSGFFALSSRFGTPESFKHLIDTTHEMGMNVIIDLVHSHSVKNEYEGLAKLDGTRHQYFHEGSRGEHIAWDSLCFDYNKDQVLHFLLSNCQFWLDEYKIDGFRFDGITSMLYTHHGLGQTFDTYSQYFNSNVDQYAYTYLMLANELIHQVNPKAITIAEDVSGMPGLGAHLEEGGCGFDFRLAMGTTDYWFKLFDLKESEWDMWKLWHELTNKRADEATISYVECHDQSIVGGKSALFTILDADIYTQMHKGSQSSTVERGIALHKMSRLITLTTANDGYLNFMGNEFGHPEWIDFPREGNNWSYNKSRRQWSLAYNEELRFSDLLEFDKSMIKLINNYEALIYRVQNLSIDNNKKIIAYERGGLFFFFNFHESKSYDHLEINTLPGKYEIVLNTDSKTFGGHGLVEEPQEYFTQRTDNNGNLVDTISIYLPNKTALVLQRYK